MKTEPGFALESGLSGQRHRRASRLRSGVRVLGVVGALSAMLGGCASAPSISVLGAYFPDWMFCIVGAIALTFATHRALTIVGWCESIGKLTQTLFYSALTALFALTGWLVFFQN